ncbi:MAG: nuclear transport factor 2 family protein [Bryobacterales bacterium]|nr:nuclear transport factor 2 family protein [Bryobacterales bacterium]
MLIPRLALLLLAAAAAALPQSAADIEALEKSWQKAIVAKDTATLGKLLADDLFYGHASGVLDTKTAYIDKIKSGRQKYASFEQRALKIKLHGDTAVTHSWVRVTGVNQDGPFDDKIMMLHVWVKKPAGWQLAGHQTARVDKLPEK